MGLNKPVHILDVDTSVRDIVNMVAVAVIDAIVEENIRLNNLSRII
jgi:malate dehydrogenase (oxaloacetate-decarboxylating)(NADP+)